MPRKTMIEAIRDAMDVSMGRDDSVVVYRGSFRVTTIEIRGRPGAVDRLAECLRARFAETTDAQPAIDACMGEAMPEAVICHSDQVAFGLYRALRQAGRRRLPRVIGYDDIPIASLWEPPLTTVSTHAGQLGRLAAQNLLDQLDTPADDLLTTITQPELVVRESCGCHPD